MFADKIRKAMAHMTMNDMNEKIMNLTDEQMEQVAGGAGTGADKYKSEILMIDVVMRGGNFLPELIQSVFGYLNKACSELEADNPDAAIATLNRAISVIDMKKFLISGRVLKDYLETVIECIQKHKNA